jgi:hypothetical protein
LANEYAAIENRSVNGHAEYGVIGVVDDSRIFQSCVEVKDYSAAVVDGINLGDSGIGIVVGAAVVDNALAVDDPFVLEESAGTNHKSPRVGKNVRDFEAGAKVGDCASVGNSAAKECTQGIW